MFSKEFMTFLVKYGEEEIECKKETVREIKFNDNKFAKLAYATVSVKK